MSADTDIRGYIRIIRIRTDNGYEISKIIRIRADKDIDPADISGYGYEILKNLRIRADTDIKPISADYPQYPPIKNAPLRMTFLTEVE